jgi:hypothetical protein
VTAGCRTLSRAVWLTACSAALLAGCGGEGPKLAGADAAPLVALAHRVPRDSPCAQARDIRTLQRRATALVNARRVPVELQEPLMSGVAALAEQAPVCLPKVPASAPTPPASPSPAASGGKRSGARKHGHDQGHGHRPGKGKRKK